ncbi:MAG: precorrin-2 C(20)-methyltransferase [Fretibacterium sp.]|nr:precorrin-2 C(20)-methyltransferase [Fretibacterium sp.]
MKLIIAGVGPGDPALVPPAVVSAAREADLVLEPRSHDGKPSVAGAALRANLSGLELTPLTFPMVRDAERRDAALLEQLLAIRPKWEDAATALLPVIGDSALYATGAYLHDVWRTLTPLELELIPGISAHSLAASCAGRFLALGEEVLCVVPGTAPRERVEAALRAADVAALYKPSALGDDLREVVTRAGPWRDVVRVDRAGLSDERVLVGDEALNRPDEYLSLLLLWRAA